MNNISITLENGSPDAAAAAEKARVCFAAYLGSVTGADGGQEVLDAITSSVGTELLTDVAFTSAEQARVVAERFAYMTAAWQFLAYKTLEAAVVISHVRRDELVPPEGPELSAVLSERMQLALEVAAKDAAKGGWNISSA